MARITVKQAAAELGLPEQAIRSWISLGTCKFGEVIHEKKSKHGRKTYFVDDDRLRLYKEGKL